ncbi:MULTISPECIES: DUF3826 domain-containing protein [Chitinophagaceae]
MNKKICFYLLAGLPICQLHAQDAKPTYRQVVEKRAEKIVASLKLTDSSEFYKVTHIVADQYVHLNDVYTWRDSTLTVWKTAYSNDKPTLNNKKTDLDSTVGVKVQRLHDNYLNELSKTLNNNQVDDIKNGMTYGVAPLTFKAYQDMIPTLTAVQKTQIWNWLVEARDHAIDAESSEKKHAWFGKYKGRINNYLSAQGYDIQKERKQWEERTKAGNGI